MSTFSFSIIDKQTNKLKGFFRLSPRSDFPACLLSGEKKWLCVWGKKRGRGTQFFVAGFALTYSKWMVPPVRLTQEGFQVLGRATCKQQINFQAWLLVGLFTYRRWRPEATSTSWWGDTTRRCRRWRPNVLSGPYRWFLRPSRNGRGKWRISWTRHNRILSLPRTTSNYYLQVFSMRAPYDKANPISRSQIRNVHVTMFGTG